MNNMEISLQKAGLNDAEQIHQMQIESFQSLLEKYQDYEKNPGAEKIEKIVERLKKKVTDYYIIKENETYVGAVGIVRLDNGDKCMISPLFILPQYQNKGIAQKVFAILETLYTPKEGWCLDTILEEKGNCHLYEKMGYRISGEIKKIKENMHIVSYEKKYE